MDNCFEAARILGIRRVVYASSLAVYGDQSLHGEHAVVEDDACRPDHRRAALLGIETAVTALKAGFLLVLGYLFGKGKPDASTPIGYWSWRSR